MKKAVIIISIIFAFCVLTLCTGCGMLLYPRNNEDVQMDDKIIKAIEQTGYVRFSDITGFEWDEMYYFWEPYLGKDLVSEVLGNDVERLRSGTSEEFEHIVFAKDGQMVFQYMLSYSVRMDYSPYLNGEGILDVDFVKFTNDEAVFSAVVEDGKYRLILSD